MKIFSKIIFLYFVWLQPVNIFFGWDLEEIKIIKFTFYQFGILIVFTIIGYGLLKKYYKLEENKLNKKILKLIFIYVGYQLFILLPISYLGKDLPIGLLFPEIIKRFSFFLIPFIYWFVLPSFKSADVPIRWINYTTIALFILAIYNYSTDTYMLTSTGELRIISGVAAIMFMFTLITNLSLLGAKKNNLFYIIISIIGLVFVNHRSAYLGLFFLFFVAIFISVYSSLNVRRLLYSALLFILILIPLSRVPYIQENFFSRVRASFDIEDPNARDRMIRWGMSFAYFLSNPLNGSMLENKYYSDDESLKEVYPPHNFILEILATQGVIGFAFIAMIFLKIMKIGYKNKGDPISLQMSYIILFYLFYALFNVTFLHHWCVLILMLSSAIILHQEKWVTSVKNIN